MNFDERIQNALRSPHAAHALRTLVGDLSREGRGTPVIVEMLEGFLARQRIQLNFREVDEEAMLDVLDALHGWRLPSGELLLENPAR